MSEPNAGQWLTISEAAELLDISERQARRYAKRLPDDDRREPDTTTGATSGPPVTRVRRETIVKAYEEATGRQIESETASDTTPDTMTADSDTRPDTRQAQAGHDDRGGELLHHLRTENEYLKGQVDAWRLQAEAANRTAAETAAALRKALDAMPKAFEGQGQRTDLTSGNISGSYATAQDAPQSAASTPMAQSAKQSQSDAQRPTETRGDALAQLRGAVKKLFGWG